MTFALYWTGVALIGDDPVELIDPFWLMEQYAGGIAPGHVKAGERADGRNESAVAPL